MVALACPISGCEILVYARGFTWYVRHVSKHTPQSFDGRQTQWVACTFSVEGVVEDSLRLSDADDLSQLTAVGYIKPDPFRWR